MATSPLFSGFDGLMTLSRREGVDIRPTLLRVLTDLYVQASRHTDDEERQFVELTSRLIDEVDDATRAAVRGRLAIYPETPLEVLRRLGLRPGDQSERPLPLAQAIPSPPPAPVEDRPPSDAERRLAANLAMQPADAAEIYDMFFRANSNERAAILHSLADTPLKASPRIPEARAERALEILEMAAFAADVESFTLELGEALILPARIAAEIVGDPGGEPLATAAKALSMPSPVFQRVLLFLKPEFGTSVHTVYRLSRLYDRLSERSALVMLAAWRGSTMAVARIAKHRPTLYDDERNRARAAATSVPRPAAQAGSAGIARTGSRR
ncbi:MAG: DUF2336 domain-containing protein [Bradyrhizobium sp.]|uniref:DUF2336 domain-containing protein n=1 Tax=Bradyrhizobium sp. TaxID=376 RepID=UPI001D83B2BA|nr:DUF2336 domain-containing protein [Bradyrhizobium sp.]MBV9559455.1 DUF2336 domain-containing protein [Bradyrhizobium sp.]